MTSTTPPISHSFTGELALADEPVAVSVVFAEGSVRLLLGGDTVGTWPVSEVRFVPSESGYELHAEGDSLPFVPHDRDGFASFMSEGPPDPEAGRPPLGAQEGGDEPGHRHETAQPPSADEVGPQAGPEDRNGFSDSLEPEFVEPEEERASPLAPDDEADEFFAAGLNRPGTEPPPYHLRSPLLQPPPTTNDGVDTPDPAPGDAFAAPNAGDEKPTTDNGGAGPRFFIDEQSPSPPNGNGNRPPAPEPNSPGPTGGYAPEPVPSLHGDPPPGVDDDVTGPFDQEERFDDHPADGAAEVETTGVDSARPGRIARLLQGMARSGETEDEADTIGVGGTDADDEKPQPLDDAENLRQWGLVAAGGLVIMAVAVMVIWGVASILGKGNGDVEENAPVTTVATVPQEQAAAPEPTTPPVVPTSASPESVAAAAAFVESWNSLASEYANHLSISAESLPIATAPEPTIHLTYDHDGILRLKMAPKGNGRDRNILLSMGLAIAWADPDISPEGRKALLADLGVDVDDPVLGDMGGELTRGGVTYRASVDETILSFEVDPTG